MTFDPNVGFLIRDSKQTGLLVQQPVLVVSAEEFLSLTNELTADTLTFATTMSCVVTRETSLTTIRSARTGVELRFDQDEIAAFVAGVKAGEFTPEALMQEAA